MCSYLRSFFRNYDTAGEWNRISRRRSYPYNFVIRNTFPFQINSWLLSVQLFVYSSSKFFIMFLLVYQHGTLFGNTVVTKVVTGLSFIQFTACLNNFKIILSLSKVFFILGRINWVKLLLSHYNPFSDPCIFLY